MNAIRSMVRCQQMYRTITTSAVLRKRTFAEFKKLQEQMQVDDGLPVFLKKGSSDKLILGFVYIGLFVCLAMSADTVKRIIYPPPPK